MDQVKQNALRYGVITGDLTDELAELETTQFCVPDFEEAPVRSRSVLGQRWATDDVSLQRVLAGLQRL